MRLKISKSKNAASLYVIKDINVNGKRTTKIVEKLGTVEELSEKLNGEDPIEWAKAYIKTLNVEDKRENQEIILKYSPIKTIKKDCQASFNGGYLFLQDIYYELGLDKICSSIVDKYKFSYDLNSILSRLVYGRIIFPSSKLSTYKLSSSFLEKPNFELQHVYRALEVISNESDFIQSALYKNSLKVSKRNTSVLYYDCTNYFFEIEQEDGLKQYGISKEHRPNPIVQMGLFMDGDGVPLAFSINKGNANEQTTLLPLERKILSDFNLSKFVVCTDAGLASYANRKFNNRGNKAFITTQSIKKLKQYLKNWALDKNGWSLAGTGKEYNLTDVKEWIEQSEDKSISKWFNATFYKERWINDGGLEQRLVVTFSFKYQNYQRNIRAKQVVRAQKKIASTPSNIGKVKQNDYKRFIRKTSCTAEGEVATKAYYSLNHNVIAKEKAFDGFYGVCTNLEDDIGEIIKINKNRWQIEDCFRIMKSEFKARPVYLSKDERIKAHFVTCFISLIIFRLLEKKLDDSFTCHQIINELRNMSFYKVKGEGYLPTYTRTDFTDDLHEKFGFRTDYQIITNKLMQKIFKITKK